MDSPPSPHPESTIDATLKWGRQLQRTVRSVVLYGNNHPATGPAMEALVARYGELATAVHLAFAPDQMIVDGHELSPLDPLLTALANHLHARSIARLAVLPGAPAAEVAALVGYLAHRRDATVESPPLPHFSMEGLEYVALASKPSAAVVTDEALPERQRELWRALVTGRLGAHEALDAEAQAFVEEMVHHTGSLVELAHTLDTGATAPPLDTPRLPGKMVARLLCHLDRSLANGPQRAALASDIGARLMELPPAIVAATLADDEAPQEIIAHGLALQPSDRLVDMMAEVVRAEGADSTRMTHCIGAFVPSETRADNLLPWIRQRLQTAAEAGDDAHLSAWRRVEEIALTRSTERYMSAAYEQQLDDFALAHFPNLSRYQDDRRLDAERLATLEPATLATDHTHLLLDLLADEGDPDALDVVVAALGERLTEAVERHDFALAAVIAADLKRHCGTDSPRPERLKQTIRQQLASLGIEALVDRTLGELRQMEATYTEAFHTFLSTFERTITTHLLDRLRSENDRRVRHTIMETLARFAADLVDELTRRLDGAPWYYARNLVHLLGESGTEEAVRPLTLALHHPDPRVAKEAIVALQGIDSPRAIPFVITSLTGERARATADHDRVRVEAARYLASHPSPIAIEALHKGVLSRRPTVAEACRSFLHDLSGGEP